LAPNGTAYVTLGQVTSGNDAIKAINAAWSQLPSTGGRIDATGLGTGQFAVTTQLTALNHVGSAVQLILAPGTQFLVNTNFGSPVNSPSSCAVPVGEGSSILVEGYNSIIPNFLVGPSANVWDVVCNGSFTGSQQSMRLDGVSIEGNASANVQGALLHLQGLYVQTRISNSGTQLCYAQCVELDAGNGSVNYALGPVLLDNDTFWDGATSGTYPGSVIRIDALSSAGGLGAITFLGGTIQFNGPHNPLIVINGRGGGQTDLIDFIGTHLTTAAASTSIYNSNVDPVQLIDVAQVHSTGQHVTGATNSTYQPNLVDISNTTSNVSYAITFDSLEVATSVNFTCLIHNNVEGSCESGFINGVGNTVIPPYSYGQFLPQIRQSNIAPPSGTCVNGSIWTNSTGTTSSNTTYRCIAGSYVAF